LLLVLTLRHVVPRRAVSEAAGARLLAADVATLCAWQGMDLRECPVLTVVDPWPDPLLRWYLRDVGRLHWVLSLPADPVSRIPSPLLVTPADDVGASGSPGTPSPAGYAGSRYRLRRAGRDHDSVILWVRRDLDETGPRAPLVDRP